MFLEGIEIMVVVEQFMACFQAESCDQAVNGLAHRVASPPQRPVVLGGGHRQIDSARIEELEVQKFAPHLSKINVSPDSLQYLAQDQVGQPQTLPAQFLIKPRRLLVRDATQIVNPYRGINDDHRPAILESAPGGTAPGRLPT